MVRALSLFSVCCFQLVGQSSEKGADLRRSLSGDWVGTLEYRDYSEAADSTKRVKLPMWLHVQPDAGDLRFEYVYDDGPNTVVRERSVHHVDIIGATYSVKSGDAKTEERSQMKGLDALAEGRGTLILTGKGTENDAPVNVRTTMRIRRNLLEILRETGAEGETLRFRHAYTMVRAVAPQ